MSSNLGGGSGGVQVGRLLVHIAENGHSIEIECDENMLVDEVQRYIQSMCGFSVNEQLLLCLDLKLEPQRVLRNYKLPCDGREVFVYNKVKLQANSPPPELEHIAVPEIADPPLPSTLRNHPLADSPDPALKALPSYEELFRYHYHQGLAFYNSSQAKLKICERLLCEQKVQERALEVARESLEQFFRLVNQNYTDFMKYYIHQHRYHSDLLANSDRDIEKLKACKLHPSLQTSSRKCLLDFVNEESLKKKALYSSTSHKQFETKVSNFQKNYSDVKQKVEDFLSVKTSLSVRNLEAMIKEQKQYISDQKSIMQSLSKDVGNVKKLVDDCLRGCHLSSSLNLRPHDTVTAIGPMYDVHVKSHLPKMQACDKHILKLLDIFREKKNEMNQFVHSYMQKITSATYLIKDARLQFPVFREAIIRQQNQFTDFKVLHGIGPSYRASLAEIVRRKASLKLYMGMAGQLAERLATKRDAEIRRREEFLKSHITYIPEDVLAAMGLYDLPSQCNVNIAPFDTSLLEIDIQDIDRHAPEHLAGLSSRSDRQQSSRGSLSMSQDSSLSTDFDETSAGTLTSEDFDCSEILEVAATSKMKVENAKLKADLAAKIAVISSLFPDKDMESLGDSELSNLLKDTKEKTAEALRLKGEYGKHMESMLKVKHEQCMSYEKRIQELEQRLQGLKHSSRKNTSDLARSCMKLDGCKPEISVDGDARAPCTWSSEHMEEASSISSSTNAQSGLFRGISGKAQEGDDENMADYLATRNSQLDTSMLGSATEGSHMKKEKYKMVEQSGMTSSSTFKITPDSFISPDNIGGSISKPSEYNIVMTKMQNHFTEKTNELNGTESKLKYATEEVDRLSKELELRQKLLDDSQMNYAHLENCLRETREEAQTNRCAAEQSASEYTALQGSIVKLLALFERLRICVLSPVGMPDFVDSQQAFAQSLANLSEDNEEDDFVDEFRQCIYLFAEKVNLLMRHHAELSENVRVAETSCEQLKKKLNEKTKLVKILQEKHEMEKQANKDKLTLVPHEVLEIAAFILNSAGQYEAINRNCPNYYLSPDSVELFTEHLLNCPNYIVGKIVHIERRVVKLSRSISGDPIDQQHTTDLDTDKLNPYSLQEGCEYFIVTVAKLAPNDEWTQSNIPDPCPVPVAEDVMEDMNFFTL